MIKNSSISFTLSQLDYSNDSENETTKVDNNSSQMNLSVSYIVRLGRYTKLRNNLSVNYALSEDKNDLRENTSIKNLRIAFSSLAELTPEWAIGPGYSFTRNEYIKEKATYDINNINVKLRWLPLKNCNITPSIALNLSETVSSIIFNLSSSYKCKKHITFWIKVKGNMVNSGVDYLDDFQEWTGNMGISWRF